VKISWRYGLALALLAAPPILGVGQTVRAGFILDVTSCAEVVPVRGQNLDESKCSDVAVTKRSESSTRQNEPVRTQQSVPSGGGGERPAPFGPTKQVPHDSAAHQSMGGTSNNLGAGSGVCAANLPSLPVIIGPDLAMRFFARQGQLRIEEHACRFFRPPRTWLMNFDV
jgi:hypothetical protein